jgi:hypothetical protein
VSVDRSELSPRGQRHRRVPIHIMRAALPAVMVAVAVVLASGCSSTGAGFNARLISPMPNNQQATNSEDDRYQPSRSPGFDPEGIESGAFAPPEGEW